MTTINLVTENKKSTEKKIAKLLKTYNGTVVDVYVEDNVEGTVEFKFSCDADNFVLHAKKISGVIYAGKN